MWQWQNSVFVQNCISFHTNLLIIKNVTHYYKLVFSFILIFDQNSPELSIYNPCCNIFFKMKQKQLIFDKG